MTASEISDGLSQDRDSYQGGQGSQRAVAPEKKKQQKLIIPRILNGVSFTSFPIRKLTWYNTFSVFLLMVRK
jgi:hypothetical protein